MTEFVGTIEGKKIYIDWSIWPSEPAFFVEGAEEEKIVNPYKEVK